MTRTSCRRSCKRWPDPRLGRMEARFTSTVLPEGSFRRKSSIREIRINQNPFSAQYDKLGYGRIEIFTKPGTNSSTASSCSTTTIQFSMRPILLPPAQTPSYQTELFNGSVSGPLSKTASFFFNAERRNINDPSVVNVPFDPDNRRNLFPRRFRIREPERTSARGSICS